MVDRFGSLTVDERDLLQLLGALMESWEGSRYDPPSTSPIGRLRALIEDNGITQAALVGPVFPTKSIASEVLAGKRPLTYRYVQNLVRHLRLPPEFFFEEEAWHSVA
jgi:antitoxin component HigA of HigAB toxin-antitoxin module